MNAAVPLRALLRREVVTQLRRVRSFVIVLIVTLILLWVVAAAWPTGDTIVWAQLPMISTGLLTALSFYLLVGAGLFIPGIAGTTIVVEREQQSWELLALTQLRPASIVLGKAFSAVGMFLVMVIALFPFIGSLYFLVGVDWGQVVVSLSLVLLTAVTCSFMGVACSAWVRRTPRAISAAYVAMLFLMGLPAAIFYTFLSFISAMLLGNPVPWFGAVLALTSPFSVLTMSSIGQWTTFGQVWDTFAIHVAYQLAIIVLAFFVALAGVKRRKIPLTAGGDSTAPPPLPRRRISLRQRLRERRWRRRKPRPPIPDRRNPMAVREIWWGAVGSARVLLWMGILLFIVSLAFVLAAASDNLRNPEGFLVGSIVIHGILIAVLCAGTSAGMFTKEHELHGMDMLRITLLTPREVVRGKYMAALRMALIACVMSPIMNAFLFLEVWWHEDEVFLLLCAQVSVLVCAILVTSLALFVSVHCKRTSTAVVGGFVLGAIGLFGGAFALAMIDATGPGSVDFLYTFSSPVIGFGYAADQYWGSGRRELVSFLMAWGVNCTEFLVIAAGAYLYTREFYTVNRARER